MRFYSALHLLWHSHHSPPWDNGSFAVVVPHHAFLCGIVQSDFAGWQVWVSCCRCGMPNLLVLFHHPPATTFSGVNWRTVCPTTITSVVMWATRLRHLWIFDLCILFFWTSVLRSFDSWPFPLCFASSIGILISWNCLFCFVVCCSWDSLFVLFRLHLVGWLYPCFCYPVLFLFRLNLDFAFPPPWRVC